MILLVGLGNPGDKYNQTRHNIGFDLLDFIVFKHKCGAFANFGKNSQVIKTNLFNKDVIMLKPQTFMNLSGAAVLEVAKFYKIETSKIIVVHDDLDLETGRIKVKLGGGDGGHNGLKSISSCLGGGYCRLRIGISKPLYKEQVSDYVLAKIKDEAELQKLDNAMLRCLKYMELLLSFDLQRFASFCSL